MDTNRKQLYTTINKQTTNIKFNDNETYVKSKFDIQEQKLNDALMMLSEANKIANDSLSELEKNTESINRSINTTSNISLKTDEAKSTLKNIERRRKYFGFFDIFKTNI